QANRIHADSDRVRHVELLVVHDAGQNERYQDVENRADHERAEDADRHIALGILSLLCRARHCIETNVGEEDNAGSSCYAAPAILVPLASVGWNERASPVGRRYVADSCDNEYQDDSYFD